MKKNYLRFIVLFGITISCLSSISAQHYLWTGNNDPITSDPPATLYPAEGTPVAAKSISDPDIDGNKLWLLTTEMDADNYAYGLNFGSCTKATFIFRMKLNSDTDDPTYMGTSVYVRTSVYSKRIRMYPDLIELGSVFNGTGTKKPVPNRDWGIYRITVEVVDTTAIYNVYVNENSEKTFYTSICKAMV